MVLFFLIPVNMLFGRLPSQAVLDRFHFAMAGAAGADDV